MSNMINLLKSWCCHTSRSDKAHCCRYQLSVSPVDVKRNNAMQLHMGEFLQDRENGQNVEFLHFFGTPLRPNGSTFLIRPQNMPKTADWG